MANRRIMRKWNVSSADAWVSPKGMYRKKKNASKSTIRDGKQHKVSCTEIKNEALYEYIGRNMTSTGTGILYRSLTAEEMGHGIKNIR